MACDISNKLRKIVPCLHAVNLFIFARESEREKESERERVRERERQREIERERETDRQIQKERDRQRERNLATFPFGFFRLRRVKGLH